MALVLHKGKLDKLRSMLDQVKFADEERNQVGFH